jgi:hypothetical protein
LVAAWPSTASLKSPGSIEIELNMMAETTKSVAMPSPSRFNMVDSTAFKCAFLPRISDGLVAIS